MMAAALALKDKGNAFQEEELGPARNDLVT